jgi:hypothetical protein
MDESADIIHDTCNKYHLVNYLSPVWTNRDKGSALLYDLGATQYSECTRSPIANYQTDHSLAAWFWSSSLTAEQAVLSIGAAGGTAYTAIILRGATTGDFVAAVTETYRSITTVPYVLNKIHLAVAVYRGANSRLIYLDGVPGAEHTSFATGNVNCITLGCTAVSTKGSYLSGGIIDAAIWTRALGPEEVTSLFQNPYGTPNNPRLI